MTRLLRRTLSITTAVAVLVVGELRADTIVILSSDTLTATSRTISGAKAVVAADQPETVFYCRVIADDPRVRQSQLDSVRQLNPRVILTVGSSATQSVKEQFPQTPTVFSSVMYPVISGFVKSMSTPGGNMTGASLTIAPDIQFKYFKRIVPSLKTIGVLYSKNTAPLIPSSIVVAADRGFRLVGIQINNERELSGALDSLIRTCDGIWSLADQNVFSPQATRYILLNTVKSGKPFMGFSRNVVASGALFALDFDYKAIGRQAGTQICQILRGALPSDIPVTTPDVIWFHYNEMTAQRLHITVPPDLVAVAKEVYR